MSAFFCGAFLVGLCSALKAQDLADRTPLPTRNQRAYNLLGLQFRPETADTLPKRSKRLGVHLDVSNTLLNPVAFNRAVVFEDYETQRLSLHWWEGLGRQTEFGVVVPIVWRNGGFLDEILNGYHRLIGYSANSLDNPLGRENLPEYRSVLFNGTTGVPGAISEGNGFGLGEVALTLKRGLLTASKRSALALRFGVKLPTGNQFLLLGDGLLDFGLSLDGRYSVGSDFSFYVNLGGTLAAGTARVPNRNRQIWQAMFSVVYHPNSRDSWIIQIEGASPIITTGNRFADQLQATGTFGYRRKLNSRTYLNASFSENGDYNNFRLAPLGHIAPDFTVSLGLDWKL